MAYLPLPYERTWIPPLISTSISVPKSSASVPTAVALHRRRLLRAEFARTASTELGAVAAGTATRGWRGAMLGLTAKQDTEVGSAATSAAHRSLIRGCGCCRGAAVQARTRTSDKGTHKLFLARAPLAPANSGNSRPILTPSPLIQD